MNHKVWTGVGSLALAGILVASLFGCAPEQKPDYPEGSIEACAAEVLIAQGFTPDQFALGEDVDPSLDVSTTGDGHFGDPIRTPAQAVAFINSGTDQASAAIEASVAQGVPAEALVESNGVSVQILVPFLWPKNTSWNGTMEQAGSREDPTGTIGVMFLAGCGTDDVKSFIIRGVCANPQYALPVPETECPYVDKPTGPGKYVYDPKKCIWFKPGQSFEEQQNGSPADQEPQENDLVGDAGVNLKGTTGAPTTAPTPPPVSTTDTTPTKLGTSTGSTETGEAPAGTSSDGTTGGDSSGTGPVDNSGSGQTTEGNVSKPTG